MKLHQLASTLATSASNNASPTASNALFAGVPNNNDVSVSRATKDLIKRNQKAEKQFRLSKMWTTLPRNYAT
jgi:hypothetical protein